MALFLKTHHQPKLLLRGILETELLKPEIQQVMYIKNPVFTGLR